MNENIYKIAISLLTAGLTGAFIWVWNTNTDNALLKARVEVIESQSIKDESNKQTETEALKNWSAVVRTQEDHGRQLANLWTFLNEGQKKEQAALDRLTRLEVKQELRK